MSPSPRAAGFAALGALLALAAPVGGQQPEAAWREVRPADLRVLGSTGDRRLAEASGLALSQANPGLFWTIGDSGNPPELLAIDSLGTLRGVVPIAGVENRDWEAVAVGRCDEATCVYIADVGDNGERRTGVSVHRVVEPTLPMSSGVVTLDPVRAETLRLRYPDHPHDVEAMGVTPSGTLLLVTKGRTDGILLFEVDAGAWDAVIPSAVATLRGRLPIVANLGRGDAVTDLAVDRTGRRVALRTYRAIYLFRLDPDGTLTPDQWTACGILGIEPQGEGITWLPDGRLLLISEKGLFASGVVVVLRCGGSTPQ